GRDRCRHGPHASLVVALRGQRIKGRHVHLDALLDIEAIVAVRMEDRSAAARPATQQLLHTAEEAIQRLAGQCDVISIGPECLQPFSRAIRWGHTRTKPAHDNTVVAGFTSCSPQPTLRTRSLLPPIAPVPDRRAD